MKKSILWLGIITPLFINFGIAFAQSPSPTAAPSATPAPTSEPQLAEGNHFVSYLSNVSLTELNPNITQAVMVVHGSDCNADVYYASIVMAAAQVNQSANTLIIAPHFKTPTTADTGGPILPNELSWTDEGWLRGDASNEDSTLDSFDVMDQFVKLAIDAKNFPNLKTMIITGHSAGGQLTQRYALGTQVDQTAPNVHFRYIPLNPGSYVYLNPNRPILVSNNSFAPPQAPACAYDDYKYGLQNLNPYLSRVPAATMVSEYISRDITYLLGEADTDTGDGFDMDCPAVLEGGFRFDRGMRFKSFLDFYYPQNHHALVTVPGVGHSERAMYMSANGIQTLFPSSTPSARAPTP